MAGNSAMAVTHRYETSYERLGRARQRVQAAGLVTALFGGLWVLAALAAAAAQRIDPGDLLDVPGLVLGILLGATFVGLGLGVLKQRRWCGHVALGLAGVLIGAQLYLIFRVRTGSLFLLVLPVFVAVANYLALRARAMLDQAS